MERTTRKILRNKRAYTMTKRLLDLAAITKPQIMNEPKDPIVTEMDEAFVMSPTVVSMQSPVNRGYFQPGPNCEKGLLNLCLVGRTLVQI